MKKTGLEKFSKGQVVQLSDGILHKEYAWQFGTVEKVIKSRDMVSVRLDNGDRYVAYPQNVIVQDMRLTEGQESAPSMQM